MVVDATFLSRAWRSAFRDLARRREIGFVTLALLAPMAVLRERVARRVAAGGDASDATLPVLECQADVCDRLSRSERRLAILINSTDPPPLQTVLERIADLTRVPLGE